MPVGDSQAQSRSLRCFDKLDKTVQSYGAMLHKMQQGSSRSEGRQVLMTAMEVELARSYNRGCYEEAMKSGALDYVEGRLSEAELAAFR